MRFVRGILMRAFGHPRGALGRLGGFIMARVNRKCAEWVIHLLEIRFDFAGMPVLLARHQLRLG